MIPIQILTKNKPNGKSYTNTASSFRQVSSNTGGSASFTPRVLWGQRFDGNSDVYGDMTVRGRIDEVTGMTVSGNVMIDGSINRAGYPVFDGGNSAVGHGWVQLYPDREYFLSTNRAGEVTDYVRFLDRIRVDKGITTSVIDASQGNFTNIRATDITTDYLTVTKKAHFFSLVIDEVKAVGGQLIITPARAKIDLVEQKAGGGWRCYFRAEDPDGNKIHNEFDKDDQIICQTFNAAVGTSYNVSNTYWWRRCTGVSSQPVPRTIDGRLYDCHWFDLHPTDCDYRSDAPAAGDECVLLGNRTDTDRQDAIIISAYRNQFLDPSIIAPSMCQYTGINSYDLASKRLTWFSKGGNTIRGTLVVENGMTVEDYIESLYGDTSLDPSAPNSGKYVHMAWSNSPSDWTKDATRSDEDWTYLGVCANDSETDAGLTYYSYRWTRIKGSSVTGIKEYYMRTEAGVQPPALSDTRWVLNNPPELTETYRWLWNYEEFVFSSTTIKTDPRVIGVFGSGKGIRSVENYYMISAASSGVSVDDEGWSLTAEPPTAQKPYLWNYEVIRWTDNSVQTVDPHIISVFSDTTDISIGFENTYRMIDAGSYAVISPDDTLHVNIEFDLLCVSGLNTVRIRPQDAAFPSGVGAQFWISGDPVVGGTISQPASSSYTWQYTQEYEHWTTNHPTTSHISVWLNIDGSRADQYAIPVILEPGSYFSTIDGLLSRVQDTSTFQGLDASVKTVWNRYSQLAQDVSSITARVSDISTAVDAATQTANSVSGAITDVSVFAHGLISQVEEFQDWFDENGDIVDSVNKISTIEQRCNRIETNVQDLSSGMLQNRSNITQLSNRITSAVTDASNRMSLIEQDVSNISMGVTDADLKRTGIDVTNGKITISADNTEFNGDIYIKPQSSGSVPQGLTLYNYAGDRGVQVRNDSLGSLNKYSFSGYNKIAMQKSGTKSSGSSFSFSMPRQSLNRGNVRASGDTVRLESVALNFNGTYIQGSAPEDDISSVSLTVKIVNGSGTVRKSWTDSIQTPSRTTRTVWFGWEGGPYEYTPSASEVLYVDISYTVNCLGSFASRTSYKAQVTVSEYAQVNSLNKLGLDAAVFSLSNREYFWAGNMKWPGRTDADYGIMMRNKRQGIAVTPVGIFRPMNKDNDGTPDNWNSNNEDSYGGWGDISSTVAVSIITASSYTARARDGFIVMTYNGSKTLTLPDPTNYKGKWFFIKNISNNGNLKVNSMGSNSRCLLGANKCDNPDSLHDVDQQSMIYVSTGTYWVCFYCG